MLSRDGGAVEMNLPPLIAAAACAPSVDFMLLLCGTSTHRHAVAMRSNQPLLLLVGATSGVAQPDLARGIFLQTGPGRTRL